MGGNFKVNTLLLFTVLAIAASVDAQPFVITKAPTAAPLPPTSTAYTPAPEPAPLWPPCDGVDIVYVTTFTEKIYPFLNDTPWLQPYKFESVVTVTNMGYSTVEGWAMGIDYQHNEVTRNFPSCPIDRCFFLLLGGRTFVICIVF
jgi:hypothetical protein